MNSRPAITVAEGREIPEEEVVRGESGGDARSTHVFQVREAVTVRQGRRRKGEAVGDARPMETFRMREAATVTLRPPHWDNLPPPEVAAEELTPGPPAPVEIEVKVAGEDARPTDKEE